MASQLQIRVGLWADGQELNHRGCVDRASSVCAELIPKLQIEHGPYDLVPPSPTFNPPASPRTRHVSLSIPSPNIEVTPPSPSSPSSSPNVRKFRRPTIGRVKQPQKLSLRGLYETQKLLSHLLDKLEAREAAPDLLDRAAIAAREVSGRTSRKGKGKTVVKIGQTIAAAAHTGLSVAQGNAATHQASYQGIGSEDVEDQVRLDEGDWDTEATYDLVDHTRGLLVLAHNQGLDLFASDSEVRGTSTSPIVRPTKRKTGRFSSFATPVSPQKQTFDDIGSPLSSPGSTISGRTLLDRLLSVLTVLINVDCLHRIQQFRLLRPPNALQAACLDIASYLYDRCNSGVKVQVIEMIIGGYYTMGSAMFGRICEWVEGRLGELLERLTGERGGQDKSAHENPWQGKWCTCHPRIELMLMGQIPLHLWNERLPLCQCSRYRLTRPMRSHTLQARLAGCDIHRPVLRIHSLTTMSSLVCCPSQDPRRS